MQMKTSEIPFLACWIVKSPSYIVHSVSETVGKQALQKVQIPVDGIC